MLDFKDRITSVFSRRKSNQDEGDNAAIANGHSEDITFSKPGENHTTVQNLLFSFLSKQSINL